MAVPAFPAARCRPDCIGGLSPRGHRRAFAFPGAAAQRYDDHVPVELKRLVDGRGEPRRHSPEVPDRATHCRQAFSTNSLPATRAYWISVLALPGIQAPARHDPTSIGKEYAEAGEVACFHHNILSSPPHLARGLRIFVVFSAARPAVCGSMPDGRGGNLT